VFEYALGLYLQKVSKVIVMPQARLQLNWFDKRYVLADFYDYDERKMDGELYEAKWKGTKETLDGQANRTYAAAKVVTNGINTGCNVNIDLVRQRKINLIVSEKIEGYSNPLANYMTLEELAVHHPDYWQIRAIERKADELLQKDKRNEMRQLMKATYAMFMIGFETGKLYDLERYVKETLKGYHYLPRELFEFMKDRDIVGTAHGKEGKILYLERKKYD